MKEVSGDVRPECVVAEKEVGGNEENEEEMGKRVETKMVDPVEPTTKEVEEHELAGHLPFRNWCRHCVRGKGKEMAHRRTDGPGGLHELHLDFMFMGDEADVEKKVTILVARGRKTKMTLAIVVPSKSSGKFMVERMVAFMREIGIVGLDVIVKTDQEPAMQKLRREIGVRKAEFGGRWIEEESPVGGQCQ